MQKEYHQGLCRNLLDLIAWSTLGRHDVRAKFVEQVPSTISFKRYHFPKRLSFMQSISTCDTQFPFEI